MLVLVIATAVLIAFRVYSILPGTRSRQSPVRRKNDKCSLAVFLGSGGHTAEALILMSTLDFQRYTPRTYVVSEDDTLSARKAAELEQAKCPNSKGQFRILVIPRARRVHQHLLATPPTALLSLLSSVYHVVIEPLTIKKAVFADLLFLNGPGTCVVLCIAVYVNKFFGLPAPKIIYVESFARVKRLSLSGRLLKPFVDRFFVQWQQLLQSGGREECRGWLV